MDPCLLLPPLSFTFHIVASSYNGLKKSKIHLLPQFFSQHSGQGLPPSLTDLTLNPYRPLSALSDAIYFPLCNQTVSEN